jgi:hypothetical protein
MRAETVKDAVFCGTQFGYHGSSQFTVVNEGKIHQNNFSPG